MHILTLREQLLSRCRHFNGLQHERCKAGVAYPEAAVAQMKRQLAELSKRPDVPLTSTVRTPLPCFQRELDGADAFAPPCSAREHRTPHEAKADEERLLAAL